MHSGRSFTPHWVPIAVDSRVGTTHILHITVRISLQSNVLVDSWMAEHSKANVKTVGVTSYTVF